MRGRRICPRADGYVVPCPEPALADRPTQLDQSRAGTKTGPDQPLALARTSVSAGVVALRTFTRIVSG